MPESRNVSRTPRPYLDTSLQALFSLEAFLPPAPWAPRVVCILPLPYSPRPRVSGVQGRGNVCPWALSILLMPALLGNSRTLWFQLLCSSAHYLWVRPAQGTARMGPPPFRAKVRQVPWV